MLKEENKKYIKYALTGFTAISMSILFFFVLFRLSGIGSVLHTIIMALRPIVFGAIIAYMLRPICNLLQQQFEKLLPKRLKKIANSIAVTISILLFILVVYVLLILIVPQVYGSIVSQQRTLPSQAAALMGEIRERFSDNPTVLQMLDEAYTSVEDLLNNFVTVYILPNLSLIMNGVGTGLSIVKDVIIGLIAAVYLLHGRKRLLRHSRMILRAAFKPKWANLISKEIIYADEKFGGFLRGKLIDSLIMGVLCYVFSLLFKFPSALLISVIIGVTNIIPFFGPFIGAIPSILLILIQEPIAALWFALFILVLQQIDGNVIGPRILGNTTGLSSFWVLFAILSFGGLFGFVGMIVGIPVFAVLYDIVRSLVHIGLRKHGYEPSKGIEAMEEKT